MIEVDKDLADIFPMYLQRKREELIEIEKAIQSSDFSTLKTIGHKLKGNAASYGLNQLGEYGKALEKAAIDQKKEEAALILPQMTQYLKSIEVKFV